MKNFAITGVAGYIASRHLKAIKDTGNNLVAAVDPHDSVGILDSYFPNAAFFTEIERFDRHLEKLRRRGDSNKIDYMTICSPNHIHDSNIRLALRLGADAICEKPLVLNPWNLDALEKLEYETGKRVYTILQLRVHPALIALKNKLVTRHLSRANGEPPEGRGEPESRGASLVTPSNSSKHTVELTYITPRGPWYKYSWKGDPEKSGGLVTNIGIHLFDLVIWLFGSVKSYKVELAEENKMKGTLELEHANVHWFLSIDSNDLIKLSASNALLNTKNQAPRTSDQATTIRSIKMDGEEIEFSDGFTDLHSEVYRETLAGRGFGIADARESVELVAKLRKK